MKALIGCVLAGVFAGALMAQPVVAVGGVLSAASFALDVMPNAGIAQGSLFTVFGTNMASATFTPAPNTFPLPTLLAGTSVKVSAGGQNFDAPLFWTTAGQLAAILPSQVPAGDATLTVTFNNQTSAAVGFKVVANNFGIFTLNAQGSGPAVAQVFRSGTDERLNGLVTYTDPNSQLSRYVARSGDTIVLYGTGLGPITGEDAQAPPVGNLNVPLEVWVGTKKAAVAYAGRSPCCAGLDQINFTVPSGIQGCYVNVGIKAGSLVSNFATLAVDPGGNVCTDPNGYAAADLTNAGSNNSLKLGAVNLSRSTLNLTTGGSSAQVFSDEGVGLFGTYTADQLSRSLGVTQQPSPGSCAVTVFKGLNPLPVDPIKPAALDAGASLTVSGPRPALPVPQTSTGNYFAVLGGLPLDAIITGNANFLDPFLDPGTFAVSNGSGGANVGALSGASINIPQIANWTNADSLKQIPRNQDLTVTWTGGDPNSLVTITGIGSSAQQNSDLNENTPGSLFICLAPKGATSFTVPSVAMQNLPATSASVSPVPPGFLLVGNSSAPVKFTASGIDAGYLTYRVLLGQNVIFQ